MLYQMLLGHYNDRDCLVKCLPAVKELFAPMMQELTQVEADRASLSTMCVLARQLEKHAETFNQDDAELCDAGVIRKMNNAAVPTTLLQTFHCRLRDFYYKLTMIAAFHLDPITFRMPDTIEHTLRELSYSELETAVADIECWRSCCAWWVHFDQAVWFWEARVS
jgi:hypothetical protein